MTNENAGVSSHMTAPGKAVLRADHVTKRYGDREILHDVSLTVDRGEVVVLVGPSGAGKSTLLRCMNLLERPDSGHVYLEGQDLTTAGRGLKHLRRHIGFVFQSFNLFPHMTVLGNVTYAPIRILHQNRNEARRHAIELLDRVGLAARADDRPGRLSGGQRQRVAIARALATDPEVLLLDEPTSALDPKMVGEVLDVIAELSRSGIAMLLVTHEMSFARQVADRIVLMEDGRIVEQSTPETFFADRDGSRARELGFID